MTKRGRPPHPDILTPAEWRVVEGVRHGLTNPAIAALCDLNVDAVKFHVSRVLGKLGLTYRQELKGSSGVRVDSALSKAHDRDRSAELQATGAALMGPVETVQTTPSGSLRLQQFEDPDGNMLAIMGFVSR